MATRRLARRAALFVAVLLTLGAPAEAIAQTDPGSGERKIADARTRLDALNVKVDLAVEDYAEGKIALDKATKRTQLARARVVRSQQHLSKQQATFSTLAGAAYRSGGANAFISLMTTSSPQTFLDKAQALDNISRNQALQVQSLRAANRALRVQHAANDKALADQRRIAAKLDETKAAIEKDVAEQEQLLRRLEDDEAKRIRAEREAERKRQIALAAARAERARKARIEALRRARVAAEAQARLESAGRERAAAAAAAEAAAQQAEAEAAGRESDQAAAEATTAANEPDPPASPSPPPPPSPSPDPSDSGGSRADIVVKAAYSQLGKPYKWGADGPDSYDCSGLTMWAWAKAGVSLPHSSRAQINSGRRVARSEARPGDLMFFGSPIHHVGIYIGGGSMIAAPQTGSFVSVRNANRGDYVGAVRL